MKERELVRDVLNLNVVGNDIALEACLQRLTNLRFCINQKTLPEHGDENVRVQFAFRVEHTGFNRARFARLAQIVGDLPVEKSQPVSPGHLKFCARREVEKG